jgi:hypothetical protein
MEEMKRGVSDTVGAQRGRLAWAARGNIDCGRVETKSLPNWPEFPAFAWA